MLSSLFPYCIDNDEYKLYVPAPMIQMESRNVPATSFDDVKTAIAAHKKIKRIEYIRASELQQFKEYVESDASQKHMPTFGAKQHLHRLICVVKRVCLIM